jgi:predicted Zn-dependent peptidase
MFTPAIDQLKSGLKVIKVPMSSLKSVTCMAVVNAGSRYEQPNQQGMAHFLEHLVFKGTKQFPDRLELARKLDSVGADSNAFTSKEYTGYYVTTASDYLAIGLQVIKELLFAPLLKPSDVQHEKKVVIEEIKMVEDTPNHHIANLFEKTTYQGTGLAHDISGPPETVQNFEADQLREFLNSWYGLSNMSLVIAGDAQVVSSRATSQLVQEVFAHTPEERVNHQRKDLQNYFADQVMSNQQLTIEPKETAQAHFVLGWPALERGHPQRYVLSVLSTILGGNRSSRLFNEIREKRGLAYYIWADIDQYHDVGLIGAQGGLNSNKVSEGIEATIDQFWSIARGKSKVSPAEVKEAKDYLTGRMLLGLEDSQSVAKYYGLKDILLDKIEDPDQIVGRIQAVTTDQVNQLAGQLIQPGELRLAIIGDLKGHQKIKDLVNKY